MENVFFSTVVTAMKRGFFVVVLAVMGTLLLSGCQEEGIRIDNQQSSIEKSAKRTEQVEKYATMFWLDNEEDLEDKEKEKELFKFLGTMSIDELKQFYDVGYGLKYKNKGISREEYDKKIEEVLSAHETSIQKRGKNFFGLDGKQFDGLQLKSPKNKLQSRSSCPEIRFPIPSKKSDNVYWDCSWHGRVRNPGTTDCDYSLTFAVLPPHNPSYSGPLKLRGTTKSARLIIAMGGINSRKVNGGRQILVGNGRVNWLYPLAGIDGFSKEIKAGF